MWTNFVALVRVAAWDLVLLAIGAAWGFLLAELLIGGRRFRAARDVPEDLPAKDGQE